MSARWGRIVIVARIALGRPHYTKEGDLSRFYDSIIAIIAAAAAAAAAAVYTD